MPQKYIKYKRIQFSLPEAAYDSVKILAQREDKTVNKYIMSLVEREVVKNDLPLFLNVSDLSAD